MLETLTQQFKSIAPAVDFWSLRVVEEQHEDIRVRQNVLEPINQSVTRGLMLTVVNGGGIGYAASCDLSQAGCREVIARATAFAKLSAKNPLFSPSQLSRPTSNGQYMTPVQRAWDSMTLADKIDLLMQASQQLKTHEAIVDWQASLGRSLTRSTLLSSDDVRIDQQLDILYPGLYVIASQGGKTQMRRGGGHGIGRQGGLELLPGFGFPDEAPRVAEQALQLLSAPDCPEGVMDVLLMPSQMMLQIHESIGHPLELDRILGDERNYAGTSFVTLDMFGTYQYGSELLNITFDPSVSNEMASYGFDDDGTQAERDYIIKDGILQKPLGGSTSQLRTGLSGVANARATSWNRPTIDRMANLNLEPGDHSLASLIAGIEQGVYMEENSSWSIDDSRNKFQFGCEYGQLIKDGELKGLVRNPNYRGISATFWRNLAAVGDRNSFEVLGTPYCGKGEPNQVIRVGHASPACVFKNIEVFGGEA